LPFALAKCQVAALRVAPYHCRAQQPSLTFLLLLLLLLLLLQCHQQQH
jgi:hypothetical protein